MSRPLRRVVLVDDHDLFRGGVRAGLGSTVEVVGEAASVAEAVPLIKELDPDVVLLDVHLPDGGGHAVIMQVTPDRPAVKFLALSVSDAAEDVIAVIRAGARGYVTKAISGEELTEAVHRVADGDAVFSPRLAGFVLDAFRGDGEVSGTGDPELDQLTSREREVLQLIARGYRYKEIAARLHLSARTVESHVSAVLRKLQLSNRNELTRWAAERRLI
jgi:DNA-binding NarL/FixJ family response regulator